MKTPVVVSLMAIGLAAAIPAQGRAQDIFPQTLHGGSGLIEIPAAWVSPLTWDFAVTVSGQSFETSPTVPEYNTHWNPQATLDLAFFGRAEIGVTTYTSNPQQGFYGQLLLLNQNDFRTGLLHVLPSIAVGIQNVGPYHKIDRYGRGYYLAPNPGTGSAPVLSVDSLHSNFSTGNTVYGVATKTIPIGSNFDVSATLGIGNGLYSNHGTLDRSAYASSATGGLFGGLKADIRASSVTMVTLMAENDAWDYNVGASFSFHGVRAGVSILDVGSGSAQVTAGNSASALFNYKKFVFSLGWQNNIRTLLRGEDLDAKLARLKKKRDALLAEVGQRQSQIAQLESDIKKNQAQNILDLEQRRASAEAELAADQARLQELQAQLKQLQSEAPSSGSTP